MSVDFSAIKLVIWDLDETFWRGVLSEGEIIIPEERFVLLHNLLDAGIMCSICSKNDDAAVQSVLRQNGIDDLFVFCSVNWSPKGDRIRQIISEMQLRAENVLFLDDNAMNLREAEAACPQIMVGGVELISSLFDFAASLPKNDSEHRRLAQYRILEKKRDFKAAAGSNKDFLYQCHIRVDILKDCEEHLERIAELVARTNQLNFTKRRDSLEELSALIHDPKTECGYVTVSDDFGDYGIVGFYALRDCRLLHFLFSCRTLNMGIEQYVYHILEQPALKIVPEVSSSLDGPKPQWINQSAVDNRGAKKEKLNGKILIKGPCDMEQMFSFIEPSPNIITEFTYINSRGVSIEHYNHTTQIINTFLLDHQNQQRLAALPFCDGHMYDSAITDPDVDIVMLSLFNDPHLGVYKEKETGYLMSFGEYLVDLTDEAQWDAILQERVFTANHRFSYEELQEFKKDFTYCGRLSPKEVLNNLKQILSMLNPNSILILCLGSEINIEPEAYEGHESYLDRHLYHKELNAIVKDWSDGNDRVFYLDVNRYVSSRDDFLNTINHMKKHVYYEMSTDFIELVNRLSSSTAVKAKEQREKKVRIIDRVRRRFRYILYGER